MSERYQPGIHPDADQLNAFVEHALPPHEREDVLTHLAVCPACRSVVSLSLPSVEPTPHPQPAPARRPWFLGWNLAWPIAAAFATLIPLILYVHRITTTSTPPIETARVQPPAPPALPPPLAPPASPAPPAANAPSSRASAAPSPRAVAEKSANLPAAARSAEAAAPPQAPVSSADASLGGTLENELYSQLPLSSSGSPRDSKAFRSMAPAAQSKPASPGGDGGAGGAGARGGNSGVLAGMGQRPLSEDSAAAVPAARPLPPPPSAATPPAAALAEDATSAASDALEVSPPAALQTNNAIHGAMTLRTVVSRAPLPSGLPALSTATNGRLVLALDTGNALFLSNDSGQRWTPVSAQWKGRAISVALASPPVGQLHGAVARSGAGLAGFSMGQLTATPRQGPGVAGIVTDATGAVIPDASVVVTDAARQVFRNTRTDTAGRYQIDGLAPGAYQLEARAPGFQALTLAVSVTPSQPSLANLTLQVGSATQTVTVTAAPAIALDEASSATPANAKKKASPAAPGAAPVSAAAPAQATPTPPTPLFEITTEGGDHWTSPDGETWSRRP